MMSRRPLFALVALAGLAGLGMASLGTFAQSADSGTDPAAIRVAIETARSEAAEAAKRGRMLEQRARIATEAAEKT
ncbi:MAG: metalloendopeptidase, partial [Erythrobacter sp.]|nr:metalloendopeptidase [Erythrobacter sp.]